ncbi:YcnI family protein [Pseudonocardia sp. WMMC193]|uniref:YcnI family copper-binding membrane protein n=1 Tax=Pseudonocardia sp. WMMC193 TaxID=2911965 RepID=UPI001F1F9082|nr:YcnI family protein [Pseudonocardia sp. WMMC193]MCF7551886.1 YcnI family protein [Pseudonocardia sp. WMMC193]
MFTVRRTALRASAVAAVAGGLLLAGTVPAFAHVTAQPGTAEQGGYTVITFRVPNESSTAGTTKLQVNLPVDHPITSARTTPQPGWTAEVTKGTLPTPVDVNGTQVTEAVTAVTWTAQPGTRIGPGQYVDFPLSVGPLPTGVDEIVLPAVQTYDDGRVVSWDQPTVAGAEEPEHPAPTVTLTPATGGGHGAHGGGDTAAAAGTTDTTARWLGGVGLLLGALGLGLGGGALLRSRRSGAEPKEKVDA